MVAPAELTPSFSFPLRSAAMIVFVLISNRGIFAWSMIKVGLSLVAALLGEERVFGLRSLRIDVDVWFSEVVLREGLVVEEIVVDDADMVDVQRRRFRLRFERSGSGSRLRYCRDSVSLVMYGLWNTSGVSLDNRVRETIFQVFGSLFLPAGSSPKRQEFRE